MTMIIPERATVLDTVQFGTGIHAENAAHMCVMECVAYVTGEPWSDHPQCVSPVIAAFLRSWNDTLPEPPRTALLRPLVPLVIGTRTAAADEETRAWMATDWLVRVHAPTWLRLAGLTKHAEALEALARIADAALARSAQVTTDAARDAVWAAVDAAGAAARDAVWDAVWAASAAAAGAAARAGAAAAGAAVAGAATGVAEDAEWVVAEHAAGVAEDAAGAAAGVAEDALAPTVAALQSSAVELVKAMCAVGREEATP